MPLALGDTGDHELKVKLIAFFIQKIIELN